MWSRGWRDDSVLRALAALPEEQSSVPSTHGKAAHTHLELQFWGTLCPLLASEETRRVHNTQTHIHTGRHPYTQNQNKSICLNERGKRKRVVGVVENLPFAIL